MQIKKSELKRMRKTAYENVIKAINEYLFINAQIKEEEVEMFQHLKGIDGCWYMTRVIDGETIKIHYYKDASTPVYDIKPSWEEDIRSHYPSAYTLVRLFEYETK